VAPGVPRGQSSSEKFSSRAPAAPKVPESFVSQLDNVPEEPEPEPEKWSEVRFEEEAARMTEILSGSPPWGPHRPRLPRGYADGDWWCQG
jgi:hypothetical protein